MEIEGITVEEVQILAFAAVSLYQKLEDPTDKFIVAFIYELGHSKFDCALSLSIHPSTLSKRLSKIKEILKV